MDGTKVTDAGLADLRGLSNLQSLDLKETRVTDAGLVHLKGLSNLQSLDLNGTKVTYAGVERLRRALPKCSIAWNPPALPAAAEMRKWSDEQLRATLEERDLGGEDELLLLEVVRRGGDGWKKLMAFREESLEHLIQSPPLDSSNDNFFARWGMSNLNLLTALRRIQNRPDPLRILVAGKLTRSYALDEKPSFSAVDHESRRGRRAVHGFTVGGDYRTRQVGPLAVRGSR